MENFDVVVIGGGHAGCEAASVSARMGVNTALITTWDVLSVRRRGACHGEEEHDGDDPWEGAAGRGSDKHARIPIILSF